MACAEIISTAKDIFLACAAIIGSIVAVMGLSTWQRQLRGQFEYELSRRILVGLLKYREAINYVRNPFMLSYETPEPDNDEAKEMTYHEKRFYGTSKAYQARWNKVQSERNNLHADLLEAEAIWGSELNQLFKEIFDLQTELYVRIMHHLELSNPKTSEASKVAIIQLDENRREVMYENYSNEADEFKIELLAAIKKIENYLKPNLNHKKI